MEPYATIDDIEARWRPLSEHEKTRAAALLGDGSCYIAELVGGEPDNLMIAKAVLVAMVKRALLAPVDQASLSSWQQGAGPYQETQTFANPSGDLYLTSSEKRMLGIGKQHASSIRPAIHDAKGGEIDGW